jgi:hypothetical protein
MFVFSQPTKCCKLSPRDKAMSATLKKLEHAVSRHTMAGNVYTFWSKEGIHAPMWIFVVCPRLPAFEQSCHQAVIDQLWHARASLECWWHQMCQGFEVYSRDGTIWWKYDASGNCRRSCKVCSLTNCLHNDICEFYIVIKLNGRRWLTAYWMIFNLYTVNYTTNFCIRMYYYF